VQIAIATSLLIVIGLYLEDESITMVMHRARNARATISDGVGSIRWTSTQESRDTEAEDPIDADAATKANAASASSEDDTDIEPVGKVTGIAFSTTIADQHAPVSQGRAVARTSEHLNSAEFLADITLLSNAGADDSVRIYRGPAKRQPAMCRIPNACVDTEGHVFVPNDYKALESVLSTECLIPSSRMSYFDPSSDETMNDSEITGHFAAEHILGPKAFRYHMPHMVEDFLSIVLPLAPYLQRNLRVAYGDQSPPFLPPMTRVQCYDIDRNSTGTPCSSNPPPHVSVLVEERARKLSWGPGVFRILGPKASRVPLRPLYMSDVFPEVDKDLIEASKRSGKQIKPRRACFGSVSLSADRPYLRNGRSSTALALFEKSVIFDHSGIQRRVPTVKPGQHCLLNVTIVNRKFSLGLPGFPDGSRNIPNVIELKTALYKESKRLGVSVSVTENDDFGSIGIIKQFKVMQNAQILISVHGAELSNMMFLRSGVSVTEVYPFRYTPTIFIDMMRSLGLRHQMYIARPDVESYRNCVYYFNKAVSPSRKAAERIVNRFEERAEDFLKATEEDDKITLGAYWDGGSSVRNNRPCGRSQKLEVDVEALAKQVMQPYEQVCYGDKT
jgi:hypothetical protein